MSGTWWGQGHHALPRYRAHTRGHNPAPWAVPSVPSRRGPLELRGGAARSELPHVAGPGGAMFCRERAPDSNQLMDACAAIGRASSAASRPLMSAAGAVGARMPRAGRSGARRECPLAISFGRDRGIGCDTPTTASNVIGSALPVISSTAALTARRRRFAVSQSRGFGSSVTDHFKSTSHCGRRPRDQEGRGRRDPHGRPPAGAADPTVARATGSTAPVRGSAEAEGGIGVGEE